MKKAIVAVGLAVSLAAFGGLALADKEHDNIPNTAFSLEQAIKAVTDQYPGRVVEAELEAEDGKAEYEITVVSAKGETREFTVDAQSGKVSASQESEKADEGEKK